MTIQQKNYDPALMQGAANTVALPQTITDATSSAFAVGPNGATNPMFQIDDSASSAAVGLKLSGTASGTACTLAVIGSGTNESLTISPKAAGSVTINGLKNNVISGSGATATLTPQQSGSLVLFDRAAGIVFTLPAPAVGLNFIFAVKTTVTSNSYKVITDAGTTLVAGGITAAVDNTAVKSWVGDGATHVAVTQAAASTNATGGIVGSYLVFECVSTTLWVVSGITVAGGTPTTPFATS